MVSCQCRLTAPGPRSLAPAVVATGGRTYRRGEQTTWRLAKKILRRHIIRGNRARSVRRARNETPGQVSLASGCHVNQSQRALTTNNNKGVRIGPGTFEEFFREAERPIRYALCARFGFQVGRDATADALAYAWEHWERISRMDNPKGYVYRVGHRLGSRAMGRRDPFVVETGSEDVLNVETNLLPALARLSDRQRQVVVMVHALGWTHVETAEFLGLSASSVQRHVERAMKKLRNALGVEGHA